MTIRVHAYSMNEITIQVTDSGVQLCFYAESGDRVLVELSDEVTGQLSAQLVNYAWNITLEEAFPT